MNPTFLRVLLAADSIQQAAYLEKYLTDTGHEVVVVEARGDATLKAARLVHPDLVVLSGPLRGALDGVALAAALQADAKDPIPVMLVTDPAELPALLELHSLQAPASPPERKPLDAALDTAVEASDE
jgi:CheY-like chemotaxis protein